MLEVAQAAREDESVLWGLKVYAGESSPRIRGAGQRGILAQREEAELAMVEGWLVAEGNHSVYFVLRTQTDDIRTRERFRCNQTQMSKTGSVAFCEGNWLITLGASGFVLLRLPDHCGVQAASSSWRGLLCLCGRVPWVQP